MQPLTRHLLLKTAGSYHGSVTTDELVPSGEASSFRSNPEKISEYTMISRDPEYVGRAKAVRALEQSRRGGRQAVQFRPEMVNLTICLQNLRKNYTALHLTLPRAA